MGSYPYCDDVIYAGEGNNLIATGTGFDTVYAGSGFDRFWLSEGLGVVTIIGFQASQDSFIMKTSTPETPSMRERRGRRVATLVA